MKLKNNTNARDAKATKAAPVTDSKVSRSGWMTLAWFGMLLVVGSIAFSSYIVYFGTTDMVAKILLVPQIVFAVGVAIYKFVK